PTPTPTPDPDAAHFRSGDDPAEVVVFDNDGGYWSYRSDTLAVEIRRYDIKNENNQPVRYYAAHIYMREENAFRSGFGSYRENGRDPADPFLMARRYKAVLAITGDNMIHADTKNKGVIIRNGRLYQDSSSGSTAVLSPDGMRLSVFNSRELSGRSLLDTGVEHSFSFGPILIRDGAVNETVQQHYLYGYNPRVGVGMVDEGHFVAIVVEGRVAKYSRGVRLDELAELFLAEGCTQAYNLDGGASSGMLFMGEYINRRVEKHYRDVPDLLMWGYSELVPDEDDEQVNDPFYRG
ncbi:MAG: phosphodiester glycosidase family protein, partial [Clostridia bacterium]|nr:phosphodiester glycosidase family protein [Clostridia bacterium]